MLDTCRIALVIAYDGSPFIGWQTQPCGSAVQDFLQRALLKIAGVPIKVVCAGRTDSGVHAVRQVVHFDIPKALRRTHQAWLRGVNSFMPETVAVQHVCTVSQDFHARYSAIRRKYCYILYCAPTKNPLLIRRIGWVFRSVSLEKMREATTFLIGKHDFSAFRSSECQALSPIRHLERLDLTQKGSFLVITAVANGFLQHMIRNIVGALLVVGYGNQPPSWISSLIQSRNRHLSAPTFPPDGLYLCGVEYPENFAIPSWNNSDFDFSVLLSY